MKKIMCGLAALALLFSCCTALAEEEIKVTKLTIVQEPDKTVYEEGEMFDPTGIIINATMSDGSVQENVEYKCRQKKALTTRTYVLKFSQAGTAVPACKRIRMVCFVLTHFGVNKNVSVRLFVEHNLGKISMVK